MRLGNRDLLFALHRVKRAHALHLLRRDIPIRGVTLHLARKDADEAQASDERIDDRLENLREKRIAWRALRQFLATGQRSHDRSIRWRRQIFDHIVEERVHADIQGSRAAEYRKNLARLDALDQSLCHLALIKRLALDVFFKKSIVYFSNTLDKRLPRLFHFVPHIFGNLIKRHAVVLVALLDANRHGEEIDDALESRFLADRKLDRHDARTEAQAQLIDDALEVGVLAIDLVDEEGARQIQRFRIAPDFLRLHLDARDGRDDDESAVRRLQGAFHLADEVRIARRIKDIELMIEPFTGEQRGLYAKLAPRLFRLIVRSHRPVGDAAAPLDRPRIEKAILRDARLPRLAVPDKGNIADIRACVLFHLINSSLFYVFFIL